jgi:putative transposase
MVELEHNKHSVGQSAYHFVFRPKYNIKIFRNPWVRDVCDAAIRQAALNHGISIFELKVMPDHVHIFVGLPPTLSVSKAFQLLKGASARRILQRCKIWRTFLSEGKIKPHLWSPGKFFRSVGCVTADVVQNYIANSNQWDFSYLDRAQKRLEGYPAL